MLLKYLKKQKDLKEKIELIKTMIISLDIPSKNKKLYLESIPWADEENINNLYELLVSFIETIEIKEIEKINETNFSTINWIRKKEAETKKEEINSFSFLLHNL